MSSTWDDVSKRHLESLEPIIHKFHRPALAIESQVLTLLELHFPGKVTVRVVECKDVRLHIPNEHGTNLPISSQLGQAK